MMTDRYPIPDFLRTPKPFVRVPIERPILFSAPMVRTLLSGTKTQTRRVVKGQEFWGPHITAVRQIESGVFRLEGKEPINQVLHGNPVTFVDVRCPYGQPGDRLWVREATINVEEHGYVGPVYVESEEGESCLVYGLGQPDDMTEIEPHDLRKRPSIHMPRSYARITLEITAVRVEQLQEISDEDAVAEGMPIDDAKHDYSLLWDRINGPGSWDANPWVWCIEFRRI